MHFDGISVLGTTDWVMLRTSSRVLPLGTVAEGEPVVLARLAQRDGRQVISALIILGDRIDSATMRSIQIGRVESMLNYAPLKLEPFRPTEALEEWLGAQQELVDRGELFPAEFTAISEALDSFQQKLVPRDVWLQRVKPPPLTRPDGSDPDGFSRQVALAYTHAVLATSAPAKVLAEEAGVPVTTVHRWIRDARLRGHLPPARKGRAG